MAGRPGNVRHILQLALTSAFFTVACWPLFEWKGLASFLPFWVIFEFYYRVRLRAELACRSCGFDPYLYITDLSKARREVEQFWRARFAERGIPFPGDPESQEKAETGSSVDATHSETSR